jgi:hypothetical protein
MPFPVTKRYFLDFRNSDTGLTPTFTFLQVTPGFGATTPASPAGGIVEKSNGRYYFDWIWLTKTDSDIVFQVDGGPSIPTEEVRYIKGTISPRDAFLDDPISDVPAAVWSDSATYGAGEKGLRVDQLGDPADLSTDPTLFGKTLLYKESIRGDTAGTSDGNDVEEVFDSVAAVATDLGDIQGVGFVTGDDSLKAISDKVDAINIETDAASIANAVWDASTTGNIGGGTMGGLLNDASSGTSSAAAIADAVWDEALSGHTAVGSFGQTLQLEDSGLAQAGAASTVTLKAGASAINDFYKNGLITITSGTGVAQSRSITAYDGATKIATVDRAWGTNPISGDGYIILPAAPSSSLTNAGIAGAVWDEALTAHTLQGSFGQTMQLLHYGTAVAGAANTVTLAAGASAQNSFYNNALIVITAGTGVGQARTITAYVGGTQVATVDRIWSVQPTGTSQYMIVPAAQAPLDTATIADAVWDEPVAGHLTAGSTGEKLDSGGGGGVSFLSNGDTVNPIIVQVSSPKFTQVKVTFSEPVVMTGAANGALNLANYSIPGLTLVGVVSLTAQQVLLTTSAQTPNFLYSLSITNIEDLVGNPIL